MRQWLGDIYEHPLTLAQLTGSVNDYDLGGRGPKRISASTAVNITGVVAGDDWMMYEVWNVDTSVITLKHQSASSAAANRIICGGAADIPLGLNDGARLRYDATTGRYRAWVL